MAAPPTLRSPLTALRGIGPAFARALAERGLSTVGDLLALLPLGYQDRRRVAPIEGLLERLAPGGSRLADGTVLGPTCVRGRVVAARSTFAPGRGRGGAGFEAFLDDPLDAIGELPAGATAGRRSSQRLRLRWFRSFAGLAERLRVDQVVWVVGDVQVYRGDAEMVHPDVTVNPPSPAVRPRYPLIEGVPAGRLSQAVAEAAQVAARLADPVPEALLERHGLPGRAQALLALHAPPDSIGIDELAALEAGQSDSHRRLAYDELLTFQLGLLQGLRAMAQGVPTARLAPDADGAVLSELTARLPFALTAAQQRAIGQLSTALGGPTPVFRLLQGDVGSGKTAVALALAHRLLRAGAQVALMAPTEVLAEQHHRLASAWLGQLGHPVTLRTGATARAGQRLDGLVVGTHALFQESVRFERLGLVIIDEQHRFGVRERQGIVRKGETALGARPHLLVMSATPIPRTLALCQHGDLEIVTLDEKPPGRQPPTTRALWGQAGRRTAYARLFEEVKAQGQVFVICPAIGEAAGEAEKGGPKGVDRSEGRLARAERLFPWLSERLPGQVALCHGALPPAEKAAALERFRAGQAAVLVATTVVEVGVDVPGASLILVENAERFGLAQLHQLRGRVGRGGQASTCLLVAQPGESNEADGLARRRLEALERESDGFAVAEADLQLRGPGELVGLRQAGVPRWRFADPLQHAELLARARTDAVELLEADPELSRSEHAGLRTWLAQRAGEPEGADGETTALPPMLA